MIKPAAVALAGAVIFAPRVPAQSHLVADSLLRSGQLSRAESLYYAAARNRPHDPVARWALGRFLAERGATRVAVTLLEEALRFGGEPAVVDADLAPLYEELGEYRELLALANVPLPASERARARWLADHPSRVVSPDSIVTALYRRSATAGSPGQMPIRVNGRIVEAAIAVDVRGVVLGDSVARVSHVRLFGSTARGEGAAASTAGAADSIGLGRLALTNVPVTVRNSTPAALIGLDVLGQFAAHFDPRAGRIALHVGGVAPAPRAGSAEFATLRQTSDVLVQRAGGWISLRQPPVEQMLRDTPWVFDARHGRLIVEP